jgi:hypothetical protein
MPLAVVVVLYVPQEALPQVTDQLTPAAFGSFVTTAAIFAGSFAPRPVGAGKL